MVPVYQQPSYYQKPQGGVATFVQGTVVLGDLGSSGQMSKGQLSKKILVQGDFCPRKLLPVISLLKLLPQSGPTCNFNLSWNIACLEHASWATKWLDYWGEIHHPPDHTA